MKGFPPKRYFTSRATRQGFTIVELLIILVVIAILAAVTVVAYNGITRQAREAAIMTEVKQGVDVITAYSLRNRTTPESCEEAGVTVAEEHDLECSFSDNGFCIQISRGEIVYSASEESQAPKTGECPLPPPSTMQAMSPGYCDSMPIYNGSNPSAVINLTDSRGGITQTYEVARLADNKCWMLTNLKLGSESGPITLTSSDSDVADSFILPQVVTPSGSSSSFDSPIAYGPVPGDTGIGSTNYGYLYNWPAATAGESRTTMPGDGGNAPYSICPSGWRLPTGNTTGELAMLNAKMHDPTATSPTTNNGAGYYENWQYDGPFKGIFSGRWFGSSFAAQGSEANIWTRTTLYSDTSSRLGRIYLTSTSVGGNSYRYGGYGIRCLLQ